MRGRPLAIVVLVLAGTTACSGLRRDGARPPATEVAAAVAIDAARSLVDVLEVVVWRAPKLILYRIPKALFYDLPRSLVLSASPVRDRVADAIEALDESAPEEERVEAVETLRELTKLPLEDAAAWRSWWEDARDRPESVWRADLADRCLAELESEDYLLRQRADARLRTMSGKDVGYDAKGTVEERAEGLERWRAWRASPDGPGEAP